MKNNTANKKTSDQIFAEEIIVKLKDGTAPWIKPWALNEAYRKPFHNAVSETEYKGANIIRLWLASEKMNYFDRRWMTYNQAREKAFKSARVKKVHKYLSLAQLLKKLKMEMKSR